LEEKYQDQYRFKDYLFIPEFRIPSPKKSRGFGKFFASLFTEDDEAALLQPEDDVPSDCSEVTLPTTRVN
jgi:hypothetical protein